MNAILYTGENTNLTPEESKAFEEAEEIINSSNKQYVVCKTKKKHIPLLVFSVLFFMAFLAFSIFSIIFALLNVSNTNIINGVSVLGVDVSGLSLDDAKTKINEEVNNRLSTDLVFKHNEENYTLLPTEIEANFDVDKVAEQAYSVGRDGNIFQNNYTIFGCMHNVKNLAPDLTVNNDLINSIESQINSNMADSLLEPSYSIDGTTLTITAGRDGYVVEDEQYKSIIISKLTDAIYNSDSMDIPVVQKEADKVNIDTIHNEIYKEAKDAYFTSQPFAVYASSTGIDFKISIDEAKALITGDKKTYEIPLKILYPNVSTNDLGMDAFPNMLASYSSNYSSSNSNRSTNIALATSKINGTVLMPGDTFSFNGTVGKRTAAAGFKIAGVYVDGGVSSDYGGGICQVSSTLYNAVLRANLEVTNRSNHMFSVGYVPIGTDATVSWGSPDFEFKNSREYPIKIVATTSNKNVYMKIYGLSQEGDYDIEILSYRTGTVSYKTTYTTDSSLRSGQTKVVQSGSNGCTSVTYKILKRNGAEVSRELVSRDTYSPHNQIIARGR